LANVTEPVAFVSVTLTPVAWNVWLTESANVKRVAGTVSAAGSAATAFGSATTSADSGPIVEAHGERTIVADGRSA
jgi:hypothetical protein